MAWKDLAFDPRQGAVTVSVPGLSELNAISPLTVVGEVVRALPCVVQIVNTKAPARATPRKLGRARLELRRQRPTPEKAVHAAIR